MQLKSWMAIVAGIVAVASVLTGLFNHGFLMILLQQKSPLLQLQLRA